MSAIINPSQGGGSSNSIQQLNSDPASPSPEEVWVLRTSTGSTIGTPIGPPPFLWMTYAFDFSAQTYHLSYRTEQGTTVRTLLS